MKKNETSIENMLTVDMGTLCTLPRWKLYGGIVDLGRTMPPKYGHYTQYIRCPWSELPKNYYKSTNFHFIVTPDRQISSLDSHSLEYKKKMCDNLICCLVDNETVEKAIAVYEYGEKGKANGHLHFHILIKTRQKDVVVDELLKIFNKRKAFKCVTVMPKPIKDTEYRELLYWKYMRKEAQNKIKCLFVKL